MIDTAGDYARTLRLTLAAEHLDRDNSEDAMADCVEPAGMFAAFAECAAGLDGWTPAGRSDRAHPAGCAASNRPSSDP